MRRRRQYDATGAVQRESLAETAEILQPQRGRHRAAGRAAADRARPDRAPDRGHAALGARPPVGRRGAAGPARRPAHRPRAAGARCWTSCARSLTLWWQTDELRRIRPRVEDEVRRNLFFFEAVLFDAVPAVLGEIEHALAVRLVQPVLSLRLLDRRRHGRPPRGRRRHAGAGAAAAPHHRAAALPRRASTTSRARSRTPRCGCRSPRSSTSRWSATPRSCRAPPCCAARTASGSRCGPSSASSTTGSATRCTPRGREPGYADAQALRRDLELVLAHLDSRHVALGLDPAAAVAGRRLRLPPGRDRHPPGRGRRARGDGGDPARATPTPTSRAARRC